MASDKGSVHVKLPEDLAEDIRLLADYNERTISGEIRRAIRAWRDVNIERVHQLRPPRAGEPRSGRVRPEPVGVLDED